MKVFWKRAMWIVIIGAVLGIAGAVYMFNKPHLNIEKTRPEFSMTADGFRQEFRENEMAANAKFLGKVVEISGHVESISYSQDGSISYALIDPFEGVTATFNAEYARKYADKIGQLKEGDEIVFKGRCDGMLTDIRISDCVIID
jgi:hypothetical protein